MGASSRGRRTPARPRRRDVVPASAPPQSAVLIGGTPAHADLGKTAKRLRITQQGCEAVSGMEPQALGLTYSFAAADDGEPYSVTIRFEGRRMGLTRRPGPHDTFERSTTVEPVMPGSGLVTVTARVVDIPPGQWQVIARPVRNPHSRGATSRAPTLSTESATGRTAWAPVVQVRAPGVRLGAWPALVSTGAVIALFVQALLASRSHLPTVRLLAVSLLASLVGVVGAKTYYLMLHPGERRRWLYTGMCIQGFVLAAIGTLAAGAWIAGLSIRTALDVSTPGLLLGMMVGRFGCFLGGCCAGRPTASRWGLWSSDRRVGVRRIPAQLLEAGLAAALAAIGLVLLVATKAANPPGVVFVGTMATYILGRQLLFPLRGLPRQTRYGRVIALIAAGVVLTADLLTAVLA